MENKKNIDESWKELVEKEKGIDEVLKGAADEGKKEKEGKIFSAPDGELSALREEPASFEPESADLPEINFISYLTSLAFQTMIFLGEIPNPITNEMEKNLKQAKLMIDTLLLLREKTKGNLNSQESDTFNAFIYELQMKYVESV